MGDCGKSFSCAITSQRSYGSTNSNSYPLVEIDSKVITHVLKETDTLQGLAIKYGASVEKIKRLNKLWSNESIHIKHTILIPCSHEVSGDSPRERYPQRKKNNGDNMENEHCGDNASDEFSSSLKENEIDVSITSDSDHNENSQEAFNKLFQKIDGQMKTHKITEKNNLEQSESFKTFTEMLSKIDDQIKVHKEMPNSEAPSSAIPVVGYNSYQNMVGSPTSPVKQHPILEQGI